MDMHANPVGITKDIYKITNNVNGKIYIGQAKNTEERFKSHCKQCVTDCLIDYAINKYGKENFTVEILESQIEDYNEREKYWIKQLDCKAPKEYNIADGGNVPPIYYGINHPNASIKSQELLDKIVFKLSDTNDSYNSIANEFHISKKTVLNINHGTHYNNPSLSYPLRKTPNINGFLDEETIDDIIETLKYSYDTNEHIGEMFGVSGDTIRGINRGIAHHRNNIEYSIRPSNATRSKVSYDELMEIVNLIQNTDMSFRAIGRKYNLDDSIIRNINNGTVIYHRRELTYPLRLPPHKK